MGASVSSVVKKRELEDKGSPTMEDVYTLRRLLLTRIPAELANIILEYAQYWPKASCAFNAEGKEDDLDISADDSNDNNATACPLVTPRLRDMLPSVVEAPTRVRKVHFKFESHDQGWGGDSSNSTKYGGSHTWFAAVIVRQIDDNSLLPDGQTSAEEIIRNILEETQSQGTEASEEGSKFVRVKHPVYDDDSWEIQRNVRAVEEYTKHEVVWTEKASGSVQEERRVQNETGAGLGWGFVQSLQLDDRIAVVARALYPGWANIVRKVEIEVYFSI